MLTYTPRRTLATSHTAIAVEQTELERGCSRPTAQSDLARASRRSSTDEERAGGCRPSRSFTLELDRGRLYGSFVALHEAPQTSARSRFGSFASVQFVFGLFFAAGIR